MNTLFGQVTVKKTGYQTKAVKGATGYTMPTKLEQILSLISSEDKQISNEIMFIPFPEIRNLIITFLKPYPAISSDQSDILLTEYHEKKELGAMDKQMRQKLSAAYHQRTKLQRLQRCFKKAQKLKITINELKNSIRKGRQNDVTEIIQAINNQARNQKNKVSEPVERQKIDEMANQKIVEQLVSHQKVYSEMNEHHIHMDSVFAEVKQFCHEMQKIVPIIWRVEGVPQTREDIGAKNFIEYIQTQITKLLKLLSGFILTGQASLQLFRNRVKSRSWTSKQDSQTQVRLCEEQLKQFIEQYRVIEKAVKQLYQKLRQVSKLQQHVVRNLSSEMSQNMKEYEGFVETFTDIKEIANAKHQWQEFERIISDQERYLSDHMKMNCGLIVYYKPTKMYEEFATAVVNRTYVEQIFSKRLAPIRGAIQYINEEYSTLYKRACEENFSRTKLKKGEVQRVMDKFIEGREYLEVLQKNKMKKNPNQKVHFEYMVHLIESLNRLMSLASV